jgi:hypothetical protein
MSVVARTAMAVRYVSPVRYVIKIRTYSSELPTYVQETFAGRFRVIPVDRYVTPDVRRVFILESVPLGSCAK